MQVTKITDYGYGCNTYVLTDDGKTAVVIDCATPSVYDACLEMNLKPVAVLLTHGHFDHVGGCGKFYENGVPIYCGDGEDKFISCPENRGIFGGVNIPHFEIYKTLSDGEVISLGGMTFTVISSGGHTVGGVCYISDGKLFTGDTLFAGSVGRCDLPTGDVRRLKESLKKLCSLDGDYAVYCGHGEDTTLARERKYNPYLR